MEIDIVFVVYRYQMYVRVRNFEPEHYHCHLFTLYFALNFTGNALGKNDHLLQLIVFEVEYIVDLSLRYDQRMSLGQRIDIEKCEMPIIFGDFVARNLSCYDA